VFPNINLQDIEVWHDTLPFPNVFAIANRIRATLPKHTLYTYFIVLLRTSYAIRRLDTKKTVLFTFHAPGLT
jgi:hypothetical protein